MTHKELIKAAKKQLRKGKRIKREDAVRYLNEALKEMWNFRFGVKP